VEADSSCPESWGSALVALTPGPGTVRVQAAAILSAFVPSLGVLVQLCRMSFLAVVIALGAPWLLNHLDSGASECPAWLQASEQPSSSEESSAPDNLQRQAVPSGASKIAAQPVSSEHAFEPAGSCAAPATLQSAQLDARVLAPSLIGSSISAPAPGCRFGKRPVLEDRGAGSRCSEAPSASRASKKHTISHYRFTELFRPSLRNGLTPITSPR